MEIFLSSQTNIVHASDSSENAEIEIKRFFEPDELLIIPSQNIHLCMQRMRETN